MPLFSSDPLDVRRPGVEERLQETETGTLAVDTPAKWTGGRGGH